jgi:hypothetical protein
VSETVLDPEIEAMITAASDNDLVTAFVNMKTEVEAIEAKHKEKIEGRKDRMLRLQAELFARMNDRGIDSVKVAGVGTAFRKKEIKAQVNDWNLFHSWAQARVNSGTPVAEVMELMQRRINVSVVQTIIETEGNPIDGVFLNPQYSVQIRRG